MALEIERKFLIEKKPDFLGDFTCKRIAQAYPFIHGSSHMRIRRSGWDYTCTMK